MAQSDQVPTNSPFDRESTGRQVLADVDLTDIVAVVTGGYSGIGLETTRALAEKGARVIVPVRSPEKAATNLAEVGGDVQTAPMDLGDLDSVRRFADSMQTEIPKLDLLINNAGIMACPEARVGPGWESQFGINHMGHFALTRGVMSLLERAEQPRVVSLSSTAHKMGGIRWDDIHFDADDYDKWQAYGQAKTANALFANALSRRIKSSGGLAFAVHPGGIRTPLQRHLSQEEMMASGWLDENGELTEMARDLFKTPAQGCATTLWAATSPLLHDTPGVYCEDCDIAMPTDPDSEFARYMGVDPHACDDEAAERLWEVSTEMLGDA